MAASCRVAAGAGGPLPQGCGVIGPAALVLCRVAGGEGGPLPQGCGVIGLAAQLGPLAFACCQPLEGTLAVRRASTGCRTSAMLITLRHSISRAWATSSPRNRCTHQQIAGDAQSPRNPLTSGHSSNTACYWSRSRHACGYVGFRSTGNLLKFFETDCNCGTVRVLWPCAVSEKRSRLGVPPRRATLVLPA